MVLTVDIGRDTATPGMAVIVSDVAATTKITDALSQATANELRLHFEARDQIPNKRGFKRSHLWSKVVRTSVAPLPSSPDRAGASVSSLEFAHKLKGGTITPIPPRKNLTIPNTSEAYRAGSASLFPSPLKALFGARGPVALVKDEDYRKAAKAGRKALSAVKRAAPWMTNLKAGRKGTRAGKIRAKGARDWLFTKVQYWLVGSVTQQPDPNAEPDWGAVKVRLSAVAAGVIDRIVARAKRAGGGG